ncbi:MAG: hypothetical protein ACOCUV_00270 [bacterium]
MRFPIDQQCHSREGGNPGVNSMQYYIIVTSIVILSKSSAS